MPDARVSNPVRSRVPEVPRERLRCDITVRIERRNWLPCRNSQIMQVCIDRHDDLPELRRPARRFVRSGHEAGVMVNRLEQCGLKTVPNVEHAVAAIGKAARSIGANVGEWRHEVRGPVAADAPVNRNEVEIADRRHDARIGFLLC